MLLIHPPCAKATEPPAGIARLAGALTAHGLPCRLWDANLEGQLWLLTQTTAVDTWTSRARRRLPANLAALRDRKTCAAPARYAAAVRDLNRLLAVAGEPLGAEAGLADYRHAGLSPLRSADLLQAAAEPEQNPFFPFFRQRLEELLGGTATVGISLNYLNQALCAFALAGLIRQLAPRVRILLGGGLVGSWCSRPGWQSPFGDLVELLPGPGEGPLLALHGTAPAGGPPLPEYGSLRLDDYLSPGRVLPYSSAAGCWWNRCSFCPERAEGNPWRPIPPATVLEQVKELVQRHRPALLHLTDNALSPALLEQLATDPPGAPWYGFVRFCEQLADPQFCRDLRAGGCVMLKLGLESGDQGVLERLHKGINLQQAARVLENLRAAGIAVYGYLLFGTPAEDEAAARRTLDFTVRHADCFGFLNLAIFNMPLFGPEADQHGTAPFYDGDLSLYTGFCHPTGWDRGKVRRFLEREFKRHPAIAPILQRDPPFFTSNHAAFFSSAPVV
ncbi:B12-binding domain-containing radical SAM protein [Trichlorobacter ammonificans]|uniref:Elp3/MiaA/NifB-like radical SAM core domain-containing protein n=1 Tax=Trichlorobacter ammonificans TaxID=2916410 RepID=A0ABM9D6N5_9BACT|nr:radical SAM protein [Trichlorobacter ammonificans]CAH2030045.1 conserved protein of unknown function [Trichlorobacter ammonificans]